MVVQDHWGARQNAAAQLINYAGALPERRPYLRLAAEMLGICADDPDPPALAYKTLPSPSGGRPANTRGQAAGSRRVAGLLAGRTNRRPMLPQIRKELERLTQ